MALIIRRRQRHVVVLPRSVQARHVWERWQRVAFRVAKRVAMKCGRDYLDMVDEAKSVLGDLATNWPERFDADRSSACTWVYTTVYWALMVICAQKKRKREVEIPDDPDYQHTEPWLDRIKRDLSQQGVALLHIVLEAPARLDEQFKKVARDPQGVRMALMDHLRRRRWTEEQIDSAWSELQEVLS